MVEEGYFFPVLSSYFPVYVYSFINEIQAVQNPRGASIPLGKRIKAKLYESRHLYMMQGTDLYQKKQKDQKRATASVQKCTSGMSKKMGT